MARLGAPGGGIRFPQVAQMCTLSAAVRELPSCVDGRLQKFDLLGARYAQIKDIRGRSGKSLSHCRRRWWSAAHPSVGGAQVRQHGVERQQAGHYLALLVEVVRRAAQSPGSGRHAGR